MSQRLYKSNVKEITDLIAGVLTMALILFLVWVIFLKDDGNPEQRLIYGDEVQDMWYYESSPSDRKAILDGLTATECIDAGLCRLTVPLPVGE